VDEARAVATKAAGGRKKRKKPPYLEPEPRGLDGYDVFTFIAGSRYVTINVVMIILALAAVVFAFGLAQAPLTIAGTSAGTVLVTTILTVFKNRRATRAESQQDSRAGQEEAGRKDPPK
jgi:hypothetical protein